MPYARCNALTLPHPIAICIHAPPPRGKAAAVRALLRAGAGAARASDLEEAFTAAAARGHPDVLHAMLRHQSGAYGSPAVVGADGGAAGLDKERAALRSLRLAAIRGHTPVVALLLRLLPERAPEEQPAAGASGAEPKLQQPLLPSSQQQEPPTQQQPQGQVQQQQEQLDTPGLGDQLSSPHAASGSSCCSPSPPLRGQQQQQQRAPASSATAAPPQQQQQLAPEQPSEQQPQQQPPRCPGRQEVLDDCLRAAVRAGCANMLKLLLRAGARPAAAAGEPLATAAAQRRLKTLGALLAADGGDSDSDYCAGPGLAVARPGALTEQVVQLLRGARAARDPELSAVLARAVPRPPQLQLQLPGEGGGCGGGGDWCGGEAPRERLTAAAAVANGRGSGGRRKGVRRLWPRDSELYGGSGGSSSRLWSDHDDSREDDGSDVDSGFGGFGEAGDDACGAGAGIGGGDDDGFGGFDWSSPNTRRRQSSGPPVSALLVPTGGEGGAEGVSEAGALQGSFLLIVPASALLLAGDAGCAAAAGGTTAGADSAVAGAAASSPRAALTALAAAAAVSALSEAAACGSPLKRPWPDGDDGGGDDEDTAGDVAAKRLAIVDAVAAAAEAVAEAADTAVAADVIMQEPAAVQGWSEQGKEGEQEHAQEQGQEVDEDESDLILDLSALDCDYGGGSAAAAQQAAAEAAAAAAAEAFAAAIDAGDAPPLWLDGSPEF